MSERSPRIELRIEELVLHGVDAADRHRIGDAVERELVRLLERGPLPPHLSTESAIDRIEGGLHRLPGRVSPAAVGAAAARAIHDGMRR
jgi:hypothetical protein